MIKLEEQTDPKSCLNRAGEEEMIFVLLGRDRAAAATIRYWIGERIRLGKNKPSDVQILDAAECARKIEEAQGVTPKAPPIHEDGFKEVADSAFVRAVRSVDPHARVLMLTEPLLRFRIHASDPKLIEDMKKAAKELIPNQDMFEWLPAA